MITKSTTIILGAGASADYGFPTGRDLLLEICEGFKSSTSGLTRRLLDVGHAYPDLKKFGEDLRLSMQPSVDAFIENQPDYSAIGRDSIAAALMPYEIPDKIFARGKYRWYEHLFGLLGTKEEKFVKNQLRVITFNYDRSLEFFLFNALKHSYSLKPDKALEILDTIPIAHVHGQLGTPIFRDPQGRKYEYHGTPEELRKSATGIKIITEADPESDEFKKAWELIANSERLVFLGFGYHDVNVKRLQINKYFDEGFRRKDKAQHTQIFGTAYHLGEAQKRTVERLFWDLSAPIRLGHRELDVLKFITDFDVPVLI